MSVSRAFAAVVFAGLTALPAHAAETRCGWLENPTPANWWLTDRDASWTIMTQGSDAGAPDGMDLIPEFGPQEWVETSNPGSGYGYGCACMSVETDRANERITRIASVRKLPLAKCEADRALLRQG